MSTELLLLKRGDFVQITSEGRTLSGMVYLASSNHHSLMVGFEGILAGWVGAVPLSWTGTGYECLRGESFEIELERTN